MEEGEGEGGNVRGGGQGEEEGDRMGIQIRTLYPLPPSSCLTCTGRRQWNQCLRERQ